MSRIASVNFATGPVLTVSGKHVPHQVFLSKSTRVEGESAESESEAALSSPEVGRVLHTINADLVYLQ